MLYPTELRGQMHYYKIWIVFLEKPDFWGRCTGGQMSACAIQCSVRSGLLCIFPGGIEEALGGFGNGLVLHAGLKLAAAHAFMLQQESEKTRGKRRFRDLVSTLSEIWHPVRYPLVPFRENVRDKPSKPNLPKFHNMRP